LYTLAAIRWSTDPSVGSIVVHSSEVIAIAELVEKEKHSNSDGVVSTATDALAGDGHDQPINFPAGDDSTHKLGAEARS
jgi:hypothetical protein